MQQYFIPALTLVATDLVILESKTLGTMTTVESSGKTSKTKSISFSFSPILFPFFSTPLPYLSLTHTFSQIRGSQKHPIVLLWDELLRLIDVGLIWSRHYLSICSVQSFSRVRLFVTPCTAAHQASLSITNSRSLPKLMSIELVMPSNHLIFCRPLLLPSIFPSIRVFSNESALHIRWPIVRVSASTSVLPVNTQDWSPYLSMTSIFNQGPVNF